MWAFRELTESTAPKFSHTASAQGHLLRKSPSDISREVFEEIRPILKSIRKRTKPRPLDLYDVFCGVLYLAQKRLVSGGRMLPSEYPKWRTVHSCFSKWSEPSQDGISTLERALKNQIGADRVTTAEVRDCSGGLQAIDLNLESLDQVQSLLADGGYTGQPFADAVAQKLGATVQIAKRNELHSFAVIPQRWIVERLFAWLEQSRRLWKNPERLLNTRLQFTVLAFLNFLLKKF